MSRQLVALVVLAACARGPAPVLVTTAETSQYVRTGRYDEAVRLCHEFARAYAEVRCVQLGLTGEGRPIVALHVRRGHGHPVIYVQAGIHAGEIEGKDAGFWFLRDLLDGKVAPGALDAIELVFLPVVNPDGHERFGPNNRPNQRGPAEMGFRTNDARLNINRDFVKAETPEMAAILGAFHRFRPVLLVDLHTTDGAKFEHDISINIAPLAPRGDKLDATAAALAAHTVRRLTELGHLPVSFYPSFVSYDDPASGFAVSEAPPRFSQCYAGARSRLGMLVETHSWRTYKERATSTYHALQAIVEDARQNAASWVAAEAAADLADTRLGGTDVTLVWDTGPHRTEIEFRGYAYEKRRSEISGGDWIVYDEHTPQIWRVPLFDQLVPKVTIHVPRAGYVIDGGFASMVARMLDRHGLRYLPVDGQPRVDVEVFRATKVSFQPQFEGRTPVELAGEWTPETRTLERGAIFVPIDQPGARVVLHLLEPTLPDSLVQWGSFNTVFERKEYMEAYVAEQAARDMIAADPSLKARFDADLAADPELAKSPRRRLEWFYKRHPAWDERVNLLPIYRMNNPPAPRAPSAPHAPLVPFAPARR
ncbi:MAG TPA: M14 family zinc carboxypeptidase [Kofleriaceae bacterium]|nr:M14 family zinc carboxypeptidase [Kofleriaceae bacterium]